MAATPQYRRGPADASGEQLPKGAVDQANEAEAQAQQAGAQEQQQLLSSGQPMPSDPNQPHPGLNMAQGVQHGQTEPTNDKQAMLFPTSRPSEPVTTPAGVNPNQPKLGTALEQLRIAADAPDAAPQLKNLYRLMVLHLNGG